MSTRRAAIGFAILLSIGGLAAIVGGSPVPPAPEQGSPLNLAILWHMHQPLYKNILTGKYEMPWVRDHTPEEYLDHPKILTEYPAINVTFNLVPSLILQIEDYAAGAIDNHIELARIDVATATPDQRRMMAQEFIRLAPWHYANNTIANPWYTTYAAWPRLNFLVAKVSTDPLSLNDTELQDLETIFFLHQISIPYIEGDYNLAERNDAIITLLQKGTGYTHADTESVLTIQRQIMSNVVGFYKAAQDAGRAEIITTPFYHPIAPLLMDSVVPSEDAIHNISKATWEKDARYQYMNASSFYQARFGRAAAGVWHSEQSVSQSVIPAAHDAGFRWTSSDEGVLWKSRVGGQLVGKDTPRDRYVNLSRAYTAMEAGHPIDIVFRDTEISNRVSFSYGGMPTSQAIADFMGILQSYHDNLTATQRANGLVTLAADGENWMFLAGYPNDGRDFLHALYQNLSIAQTAGWLRTWTIGSFLAQPIAKVPLSTLHSGSWIDADFRTWSGEEEEQVGWARLVAARRAVVSFTLAQEGRDFVDPASSPAVKRAWEAIFTAEGSDWFWWYGDDQSSGDDGKFDLMFKAHLITAYVTIGATPPRDLRARWSPSSSPDQPGSITEASTPPTIDGIAVAGEWDNATGWTQAAAVELLKLRGVYAFLDAASLHVRVDLNGDASVLRGTTGRDVELFISHPVRVAQADMEVNLNRYGVNFASRNGAYTFDWAARYRLRVVFSQSLSSGVTPWSLFTAREDADHLGDGGWTFKSGKDNGVVVGPVIEILVPLTELGTGPGDVLRFVVVTSDGTTDIDILPAAAEGPGEVRVLIPRPGPPIAIFLDPQADDVGDGDYTYAQSPDFRCSSGAHCEDFFYDLTFFNISDAPTSVTFTIGVVDIGINQWSGPNGFAYEIFNVYIDSDRVPGSGNRRMLEGANAEVTGEFAWEAAVQAAGWSDSRTFVTRDPAVTQRLQSGLLVRRALGTNNVEITVPKALLPAGDPKSWGYVVVSGGQDGFGPGWWRPIAAIAGTWVGGGAGLPGIPPGNHPRIYDAITSGGVAQTAALGSYTASALARIPGVIVEVKAPTTPSVATSPATPWSVGDVISVTWSAQPNPETQRPIVSYDVSVFHTATDVLLSLDDTTNTQGTFTVTKELNVTIRVTAFDGFATSPPFVQEYEVRRSPPPPAVNRAPVLTNPTVEPADGDERTVFLFSVRYVDPDGDAPAVSLVLDGTSIPMGYVGGGNGTGAVFRVSRALAAGDHTFKFSADDRNGTAHLTAETPTFTVSVRSGGPPTALFIGVAAGGFAAAAGAAAFLLYRRRRPPEAPPEEDVGTRPGGEGGG